MESDVRRYGLGTACSLAAFMIALHLGAGMLWIVVSLMLTIGNGGALYDTIEEINKRKNGKKDDK